jgi:hypothetical protein
MIGFQTGNPLAILDELRTLAAPVTTFFSGGKFADRSQAMDQNLKDTIMSQYDKTGIMSGNIGYSDFDKSQTPGAEFPNLDAMRSNLFSGDMSLPAFSNATTLGRVNYDIDPNTGKVNFGSNEYNFRPEMATIDPSDPYGQQAFSYFAGKANERNREINPDISIPVDYLRGFGRDFSQFGDSNLGQKLADSNLSKTLSNSIFTPAYGDIPTKEERDGLYSFDNLVSDTVIAQPKSQFQDYPGDKNLGSVQDFDLEGVQDIISQMEEEKGNYIERPEDKFNMDSILQSLGGFAKNTAGRYIGSQALGGAGGMLFGPIGGLVGGIIGALKGGDLFNQNTYSQQMYNNLTSQGQGYVDRLYGPGGVLQGYNQFSAFGKGALGTIANILAKNPNMSLERQNVYRTAADKYISGIDPIKQGIAAVTKPGTYSYDDAYINYAPPSGGDSGGGGGSGGETYGSVGSYEDFGTTY